MDDQELRIIIIDDNPSIHEDFIKVLSLPEQYASFNDLDSQLFNNIESDIEVNLPPLDNNKYMPKFHFETALQGLEGIEKIQQAYSNGIRYALAFVDVRMPPGLDGVETIKRIWKIDPDIQIVVCTAYSDYSWEDTVENLSLNDNYLIIKKPFDKISVRQLACSLTRKWTLSHQAKQNTELLTQKVHEKTMSLQQSLALLRSTIESSTDGILVLDLENNIVDYNRRFINIWDYLDEDAYYTDGYFILSKMQANLLDDESNRRYIESYKTTTDTDHKFKLLLNSEKIIECIIQPHLLNDKTIGRVFCFRDITQQALLKESLEYQANHDVLTGLANRVLLRDRIEQAIKLADRNHSTVAVLFFDLDRFKSINDNLSHAVGDKLLCIVAKRLSSLCRQVDTLARIGGDEFVMVVSDLKDFTGGEKIAEKIIKAFDEPFHLENREMSISTSIGISLYPCDGNTPDKLLRNADLAMYQAKEQVGNHFHFYSSSLDEIIDKRFRIENEIRAGLIRNEFVLYYQPLFNLNTKETIAMEALLRWQHPEKGLVLPIEFITEAEESYLIIPLGEWVIREVCRQLKEWEKNQLPIVPIAINVATQQLKQKNFTRSIQNILKEFQVNPHFIEIEITENVIITQPTIIETIQKLRELGFRIVMDDFGTGQSSLSYLKEIYIDRLKIDQSFINNISSSQADKAIIDAIISMGKSMDFKVLAEGVESKQQMKYLHDKDCQEVQGRLFSKPLDATLAAKFLKKL